MPTTMTPKLRIPKRESAGGSKPSHLECDCPPPPQHEPTPAMPVSGHKIMATEGMPQMPGRLESFK